MNFKTEEFLTPCKMFNIFPIESVLLLNQHMLVSTMFRLLFLCVYALVRTPSLPGRARPDQSIQRPVIVLPKLLRESKAKACGARSPGEIWPCRITRTHTAARHIHRNTFTERKAQCHTMLRLQYTMHAHAHILSWVKGEWDVRGKSNLPWPALNTKCVSMHLCCGDATAACVVEGWICTYVSFNMHARGQMHMHRRDIHS